MLFVFGIQMSAFAILKKPNTIISGTINMDDQYEAILSFLEKKVMRRTVFINHCQKTGNLFLKSN